MKIDTLAVLASPMCMLGQPVICLPLTSKEQLVSFEHSFGESALPSGGPSRPSESPVD